LNPDTPPGLCDRCLSRLEPIDPSHGCAGCGRDLRQLDRAYIHEKLCHDCLRWAQSGRSGLFGVNRSLYTYNEMLKDIMTAFKFRGDAVIAEAFRMPFQRTFQRMTGSDLRETLRRMLIHRSLIKEGPPVVVPVPLSRERLAVRGFNQADCLAKLTGRPTEPALIRVHHEEKQSKKNRRERMSATINPFKLVPEYVDRLSGRRILLIDDIYTTGVTIRQAAAALSEADPERIDALTLAHG
jgi:competence protein ComFC